MWKFCSPAYASVPCLFRGGGGGYNYDDDYYGGAEGGGGDDPYYEDGAGGWGDDGWGVSSKVILGCMCTCLFLLVRVSRLLSYGVSRGWNFGRLFVERGGGEGRGEEGRGLGNADRANVLFILYCRVAVVAVLSTIGRFDSTLSRPTTRFFYSFFCIGGIAIQRDDRGGDRYDPYEERRGSSKRGGRGRGKSGAGGFDLTGTISNGNKSERFPVRVAACT